MATKTIHLLRKAEGICPSYQCNTPRGLVYYFKAKYSGEYIQCKSCFKLDISRIIEAGHPFQIITERQHNG